MHLVLCAISFLFLVTTIVLCLLGTQAEVGRIGSLVFSADSLASIRERVQQGGALTFAELIAEVGTMLKQVHDCHHTGCMFV